MHNIGHFISVVSWVYLIHMTCQGYSLCPSGTLLPPLVTPFQPEPARCSHCRLHAVADGSPPAHSCNDHDSVGLAEEFGSPATTSTGMHLVLHSFLLQSSTSYWYFDLFLSCTSSILSTQDNVDQEAKMMICLAASVTKMVPGLG